MPKSSSLPVCTEADGQICIPGSGSFLTKRTRCHGPQPLAKLGPASTQPSLKASSAVAKTNRHGDSQEWQRQLSVMTGEQRAYPGRRPSRWKRQDKVKG